MAKEVLYLKVCALKPNPVILKQELSQSCSTLLFPHWLHTEMSLTYHCAAAVPALT